MPHVRKIRSYDELWELRVTLKNNKYRIFYFSFVKTSYVLLHAFQKKDQKTPKKDIEIAKKRKKLYLDKEK
jgi:phage-related protein